MAEIQNYRDKLLQAASPRVVPIPIPIDQIDGLPQAIQGIRIKTEETTFIGSAGGTSPAAITLTAERVGGLSGAIVWTVIFGTATIIPDEENDLCVVIGSSIVGRAVTIRARINSAGRNYDAQFTLTKLGQLSVQEYVDLTSQVTGQLAMGNVTGYGALALLNQVDLNTQTVGALNGVTQVTNLGDLAYANAIAANQIGAGTLAAGVIYAGVINAESIVSGSFAGKSFTGGSFTGGNFTGGIFQTSQNTGEARVHISGDTSGFIRVYGGPGAGTEIFRASAIGVAINGTAGAGTIALSIGSTGAGVRIQAANGNPAIILAPTSVIPPAIVGGIAYHTSFQFIFSNGSKWFTPTWTQID